jgi:hypothetical protein
VRILVSAINGRTQTEGVCEKGAEEKICTEERQSERRLEKTA